MEHPTDATLRVYEERTELYTATSPSTVGPEVGALLDAVVARLPAGGRVLELGTGPGLLAAYLEQRGLVVDRTDAATAFVDRLRRQGLAARVLDARDGDLGGPYDGVLANAVLLHLDRDAFARSVEACLLATRAGGLLALTLKEGDGEGWSEAKLGAPRWFVYWREDALRQVLQDAGWHVADLRRVQGRTEPWLHVVCERPAT